MAISLQKIIASNSLRGIGSIQAGVAPHKLISAGHSARDIAERLGGTAFKVGRINPRNAFCVFAAGAYYLYVHRKYSSYRSFFHRFFGLSSGSHDIDHVMSRNLALIIGVPYLLLASVPRVANRSHGTIEKRGLSPSRKIFLGKTFPLDERMFHKVMGRRVGVRQNMQAVKSGYVLGEPHTFGVTLKQNGIWNLAFCVHLSHAGVAIKSDLRQL